MYIYIYIYSNNPANKHQGSGYQENVLWLPRTYSLFRTPGTCSLIPQNAGTLQSPTGGEYIEMRLAEPFRVRALLTSLRQSEARCCRRMHNCIYVSNRYAMRTEVKFTVKAKGLCEESTTCIYIYIYNIIFCNIRLYILYVLYLLYV